MFRSNFSWRAVFPCRRDSHLGTSISVADPLCGRVVDAASLGVLGVPGGLARKQESTACRILRPDVAKCRSRREAPWGFSLMKLWHRRTTRLIAAAVAVCVVLVFGVLHLRHSSRPTAQPRTASTSPSITLALVVGARCPASVTLPAWTHNKGVSTVQMTMHGAVGYVGDGHQEAVLAPQNGWQVFLGGPLAVTDATGAAQAISGWRHLPGTGRVRVNNGTHWRMVAAWRAGSHCLSVTTSLSSLPMMSPVLQVARVPDLAAGDRVDCRLTANDVGHVRTACRIVRGDS